MLKVTLLAIIWPLLIGSSYAARCSIHEIGKRFPHPLTCNKFYICNGTQAFAIAECPRGLHFNAALEMCDLPLYAGCSKQIVDQCFGCDCNVCCGPTESSTMPPTNEPSSGPSTTDCNELGSATTLIPGTTEGSTKAPFVTVTPSRPNDGPTAKPTDSPIAKPTNGPTIQPTTIPTDGPTAAPTVGPSDGPAIGTTDCPTNGTTEDTPTAGPTVRPTARPTDGPTKRPTVAPTDGPSIKPTDTPTAGPTNKPTISPTLRPTIAPTLSPTQTPGPTNVPPPNPLCTGVCCDTGSGQFPKEGECQKYIICRSGKEIIMTCPNNLQYNEADGMCDFPENAKCRWPSQAPSGPHAGPSGTHCNNGGRCVGQRDGITFPSSTDECSADYVVCQCECEVPRKCSSSLMYNPINKVCDWPNAFNCA